MGTIFFLPNCSIVEKLLLLNKNEIKMLNKCHEILENLPPIVSALLHQSTSPEQIHGNVAAGSLRSVSDSKIFVRWIHESR